ncbi:MAG: ankyrin repeat domain-containing protein [Acidobacteriota bacterium]|nr:MAG: ankyrin repeat domain-containing protein [Acidobacteriota bacterium]
MAFKVTKDFPEAHSPGGNGFHDVMFPCLRTLAFLLLLPLLFAQAAYGGINKKLLKAAKAGDTATVEQLLGKGADVNARNKFSGTALGLAKGNVEIISLLLLSKEMTLEKNPAP